MSGLIMTISDDEDDQQQQQVHTFSSLTAAQKLASRQQASKLNSTATPAAAAAASKKKSLAQQMAEAEAEDEEMEDVSSSKKSKAANGKKAPAQKKRKASAAELDDDSDDGGADDEDDDALPASGAFEWDADATRADFSSFASTKATATILPPSKMFQPYAQASNQTSLQQKIEQQLKKSEDKKQKVAEKTKPKNKKSKDSDDEMASSSSDDEDSEGSDSDDDAEDDADQVDDDVDMHQFKDDEVKKKVSTSGPKIIAATPLPAPKVAIQDFASLRLSRPLLRAISELGWTAPTPVQASSILPAVAGKDLLVNAVTGSGKTGAFMLPILERLLYRPKRVPLTRVLVLLPTRELAAQCYEVSQQLARHTDIRLCLVVGGLSEKVQEQELRSKPDVILATPGRLIDHLRNSQNVHLEDIEILVLDEADRLLECGFAEELREIIKECPKGRQTLLFSATLTETVVDLVNLSLNEPVRVKIDAYESIVDRLKQEFIRIRDRDTSAKDAEKEREAIVLSLAKRSFKTKTIIFMQSKIQCHRMSIIFGLAKLKAAELQGNMTQTQRLESLEQFRTGAVDFLLCTDLAARGLDIAGVETVVNMSMPRELRAYIHRVGRTARAGRSGRAVTLVGEGQRTTLKELVKKARDVVHSRVIAPEVVEKFRSRIQEMDPDIRAVFDAEAEEKAARIAEMEANKAANTMQFEEEIHSRPAKSWFQTPAEKAKAKEAGVRMFETEEQKAAREKEEATKKLTPRQLAKLEAKEKKLKEKTKLLGLSRSKKRRKLMQMEDEKYAREAAKEASRSASERAANPDSLKAQIMKSDVPLPPTLAQAQKIQRAASKSAKKAKLKEKNDELGVADTKEKRRELQAMQMLAKEKKKGNTAYYDGAEERSAASSSNKNKKETSIIGSNFRYKDRTGSGDDRYKLPARKFKEEVTSRKKGESTNHSSGGDKKKGTKKAHHAFKSQSKFRRR